MPEPTPRLALLVHGSSMHDGQWTQQGHDHGAALARDLGPKNIRVNSVLPGWIMTQRQIDLWLTPEGEQELMTRQCLKRKLYPEDIAKVVLFFASDDSGACTNQNYIADGGWV